MIRRFLQEIRIYDCGFTKIRLGNRHDGGYVVLKELCGLADTLYSFGVGNDVSFEMDFINRFPQARVELFDPSIDELPESHPRFRFHKYGIGHGYNGPRNIPHDAFLKMDVEGAEWAAIGELGWWELEQFSQMVIEFHVFHVEPRKGLSPYFKLVYGDFMDRINQKVFKEYCAAMSLINNKFYCYHAHVNNSLPLVSLNGHEFPPLLEMSFIRKDLALEVRPSKKRLPIQGLDFPNKTDRPDVAWQPLTRREDHAERAF